MKEVVKYHNDMNIINFKNFKSLEMDLFFAICYKMKEQERKEITISFEELKELTEYKRTDKKEFINYLESLYKKMMTLDFREETNKKIIYFILFTGYVIDKENKNVLIQVNEKFSYILNNLTKNFTRFELEMFVKIKSSYLKNLFKLLSQFNSTGTFIIPIDEFRERLDVPKTYRATDINERILKPALKELSFYFNSLKLEKIKKGRVIDKLKFTWKKKRIKQIISKGKIVKFDVSDNQKIELKNQVQQKNDKLVDSLDENTKIQYEELKKKLGNKVIK